jgi:tetratricopeptide (TPR) repeat protein
MLESLAAALPPRLPSTAWQIDDVLLQRFPNALGPLRRRIAAATSDVQNGHVWCLGGSACAREAISTAETLIARAPDKCEPRVLLARLLIANGDRTSGLDGLANAIDVTTERAECLRAFVTLAIEVGDRRRADAGLEKAARSGCGTRDECISLYHWAASVESNRGNAIRAIAFWKRAAQISPNGDDELIRVAEAAEQAGLIGEALEAYETLARRRPLEPRWREKADEQRKKARASPSLVGP